MQAWTEHGGRLEAARAAFGGARDAWLDLSTGINPHAWPGAAALTIDWRALPDPAALAALEAAAAAHFGADPAAVCAVPGTEIALRMLLLAVRRDPVHVVPSYGTHAAALPGSCGIAIGEIDAAAGAGRTILLANPNNPDGRVIATDRLLALARMAQRCGGRLIIDEAFADAMPGPSLAPYVAEGPVVLRSFGKFFGLAGVRLGFVIAPPEVIAAYRRALGDWPVSAAAIAIGTAAYRDADWTVAMRARIAEDAAALDCLLARHGFAAIGGCPLFRLIETERAGALFERLARRHILTRPFADNPRWLRFGLPGGADALARLDAALADG